MATVKDSSHCYLFKTGDSYYLISMNLSVNVNSIDNEIVMI